MGHVYVDAVFYNPVDYTEFVLGKRRFDDVRKVSSRSLVDIDPTFSTLLEDIVKELGLPIYGETEAETATGRGG